MQDVGDTPDSLGPVQRAHALEYKLFEDLFCYRKMLAGSRDSNDNRYNNNGSTSDIDCWLPKLPEEREDSYKFRVASARLYPGFSDAVEGMSVRPFKRRVLLNSDNDEPVPDSLAHIEDNANGQGSTLTSVASVWLRDLWTYGIGMVFVNVYDGERPVFERISPRDLLAHRSEVDLETGRLILTHARIRDRYTYTEGNFKIKEGERIRVYDYEVGAARGTVTIFRKDEKGRWIGDEPEDYDYPGIPLIESYIEQEGFFDGRPPLRDIAYLNLFHWRSGARQYQALEFARIFVFWAAGVSEDEISRGIRVVPGAVAGSQSPSADLKSVEHNGTALGSGWTDLDRLEDTMQEKAVDARKSQAGTPLATGYMLQHSENQTKVERAVRSLENGILRSYEAAGRWTGDQLPAGFGPDIWSDFRETFAQDHDLQHLRELRKQGDISRKTLLEETARRSVVQEGFDVEDELSLLAEEESTALEVMREAMAETAVVDPGDPGADE